MIGHEVVRVLTTQQWMVYVAFIGELPMNDDTPLVDQLINQIKIQIKEKKSYQSLQ